MDLIKAFRKDEDFIKDVAAAKTRPNYLHIWWLGQSGFLVLWENMYLLIDPYLSDSLTKKYASTDKPHIRMTEKVIAPDHLDFIDLVSSSHNHTDHLDRTEDIVPIAQQMLKSHEALMKDGETRVLTEQAKHYLTGQKLKGNLRDLEKLLGRATIGIVNDTFCPKSFYKGEVIEVLEAEPCCEVISQKSLDDIHIDLELVRPVGLKKTLCSLERNIIITTLEQEDSVTSAAKMLGQQRTTLTQKMSKYGLNMCDYK